MDDRFEQITKTQVSSLREKVLKKMFEEEVSIRQCALEVGVSIAAIQRFVSGRHAPSFVTCAKLQKWVDRE